MGEYLRRVCARDMGPGSAIVVAALVLLFILLIAAFMWYNYVGWNTFSYKTGDTVSWASSSGQTKDLRFKGVTYTLTFPSGAVRSWDVTPVLNGMAVAYRSTDGGLGVPGDTGTLSLRTVGSQGRSVSAPLGAFSFIKTGLNDARNTLSPNGTVPDPTVSPWPSVTVMLAGQYRTI